MLAPYIGSVPLRPAVLRFIPEPPGSFRFMDRDVPGENDVFLPKKYRRSTVEALKTRELTSRGTPVHPGRAPAGPRFIPALTRLTPVLGPVLHGSPRSMPGMDLGEPWRTGPIAGRTPVTLRFFPVLHGGATVLPGSPRFPHRDMCGNDDRSEPG